MDRMPNTLLVLLKFQNIHDLINFYTYIYAEKSEMCRKATELLKPFFFLSYSFIIIFVLIFLVS